MKETRREWDADASQVGAEANSELGRQMHSWSHTAILLPQAAAGSGYRHSCPWRESTGV